LSDAPGAAGPYRGGSGGRWGCIVCYRYLSPHAGLCPQCGVDLLSLADPNVRAELRAEAERRLQKRMYGEYFALSLLGFAIAIPILPIAGEIVFIVASLGVGQLATRAWARLRPRSALALYAQRRQRLALELAGKTQQRALPAAGESTHEGEGDPADLDLDETISWLGMSEAPPKK
jgi:hypothetical protein